MPWRNRAVAASVWGNTELDALAKFRDDEGAIEVEHLATTHRE